MGFKKTAITIVMAVMVAGFLMLRADTASAYEVSPKISVERHDPSFYTSRAPADTDTRIDPRLLSKAYKSKLFCIPNAGKRKSVYHSYLWVVVLLHAGGGAALAFVLVGDRIQSFFSAILRL